MAKKVEEIVYEEEVASAPTNTTQKRYKVTTPNEKYSGYVYGVAFNDGEAVFDNVTLSISKRALIKDADQLAQLFKKEFNYTVTIV